MLRRRGGPGVMSTMARTAVIAGTATAASNKVNARAAARAGARQLASAGAAPDTNAELGQIQEQLTTLQAQQAEVAALGESGAMVAQLQQLAQMRESGLLSEEEFAAAKARLLAGSRASQHGVLPPQEPPPSPPEEPKRSPTFEPNNENFFSSSSEPQLVHSTSAVLDLTSFSKSRLHTRQ